MTPTFPKGKKRYWISQREKKPDELNGSRATKEFINFYNSNKQVSSESYKIIEIDFFSQITNEKKIKTVSPLEQKKPSEKIEKKSALDQEEKSLIPEKEVKNKIPRETESSQKKKNPRKF